MARQQVHQIKPEKPKNVRRVPVVFGGGDASVNRQASHKYFLSDKIETGIMLRGTEVKSVRAGQANLKDAFAQVKDNELWLLNAHIGPYEHGNVFNHEPTRTRKLLAKKDPIPKLSSKSRQKGVTLVPTRMYFKNGSTQLPPALAHGPHTSHNRETERKR